MNLLRQILNANSWRRLFIVSTYLRRQRVPVFYQTSATECGAVCLAMILHYYGYPVKVSDCQSFFGVGRDGLSAQAIAQAARQYGLRTKAYSLEPEAFRHIQLPAIVHWNFNHFVIVERWSLQKVQIVDPAIGRCQLTADEFDKHFTGVVLTCEPGAHFNRSRAIAQPAWHQYLKQILHVTGTPNLLTQILIASLGLQALGLSLPIFTKVLVDQVLPFQMTNVMTFLGIGIVILVFAQILLNYLRTALLIYLQARLDTQMMLGFFEHVLTLSFSFFQQRTSGDLLMRLSSNMTIREILANQTVSVMLDGSLVFGYLTILLVQAPLFGVLVLGVGLLHILLIIGTTRRMKRLMQLDLATQSESQSYLVEVLAGIITLKASGTEDRSLDHWANLFFKYLNVSIQRSYLSAVLDTAMVALRTFTPLFLLWMGSLQVLDGKMSLGTMLALNTLAATFLVPLTTLVEAGQQFQKATVHLERLSDVWMAQPEQDIRQVQIAPHFSGRIELKQVSFRYHGQAPWVLKDVSLTIEPGQKVAIVGPTGSGKSTLMHLLLGLYQPTEGEIYYDGIPLHCLNYRTVRNQIGVVLQEPFLFSGSIRHNIAFNYPTLLLEQVIEAAQSAAIHDEIMQMPMGYETMLGEGGTGLSGGQRQRLVLARALAYQPAILLLDEATSHLDTVTEYKIDQKLNQLACTRIVIAHRLSTIRNADIILVLDRGMIIERGAHEELLQQEGHYAALVQSQLHSQMENNSSIPLASGAEM